MGREEALQTMTVSLGQDTNQEAREVKGKEKGQVTQMVVLHREGQLGEGHPSPQVGEVYGGVRQHANQKDPVTDRG